MARVGGIMDVDVARSRRDVSGSATGRGQAVLHVRPAAQRGRAHPLHLPRLEQGKARHRNRAPADASDGKRPKRGPAQPSVQDRALRSQRGERNSRLHHPNRRVDKVLRIGTKSNVPTAFLAGPHNSAGRSVVRRGVEEAEAGRHGASAAAAQRHDGRHPDGGRLHEGEGGHLPPRQREDERHRPLVAHPPGDDSAGDWRLPGEVPQDLFQGAPPRLMRRRGHHRSDGSSFRSAVRRQTCSACFARKARRRGGSGGGSSRCSAAAACGKGGRGRRWLRLWLRLWLRPKAATGGSKPAAATATATAMAAVSGDDGEWRCQLAAALTTVAEQGRRLRCLPFVR
ncbi:unnamed protein product [Phaeothamnion confervicola]